MTPPGLGGRLVSASFARDGLATLPGAETPPADVVRALERWNDRRERSFGPASGTRAVADGIATPLLRILGYGVLQRGLALNDGADRIRLDASGVSSTVPVLVVPWEDDLGKTWRAAVLAGIGEDARWSLCTNGRALRICDAHHTWSRDYLEFDFDLLAHDSVTQQVLWTLARASSLTAVPPVLDLAVELSAKHGRDVCRALGDGVLSSLRVLLHALASAPRGASRAVGEPPEDLFEQALTVVYRILFLLFAEARGLVPMWHPVYRDRYTIDAIVSALLAGRTCRGAWAAIQAISRLAHAGCTAGELRVTAFNGRLFAPSHAPAFERRRVADDVMAKALLAVSTTQDRGGRTRIQYRDLDVEQLGTVYEHVLEYQPSGASTPELVRTRDVRQASGTFYTPRQITAWLVRRTLAPLVHNRSADEILSLRVLDPAMGSGAFLVAACRFLAHAAEDALVGEGRWHSPDVTADDRAALRRDIAQRCLFGVDLNPVAVQLARLSIWLATLAANRPLTFLDHHLVAGNSLVGATFDDLARQPGGGRRRQERLGTLPLFADDDVATTVGTAVRARVELTRRPDDSAAAVREKERALGAVHDRNAPLGRWQRVLDLWCAGWFLPSGAAPDAAPDAATFGDLVQGLLHDGSALPARVTAPFLQRADEAASAQRFLHWPVAFPEAFRDESGATSDRPGFDAVLGNPPWDMVRGDSGDGPVRDGRRDDARQLAAFVRESGVYRIESRSHLNRYALFVERALQLTRRGGRIGLVLPGGLVSDVGTAPLRRHLFNQAAVDSVTGLDNRARIFPIHRSVRFVLLTCTTGEPTTGISCRFGVSRPETLESDEGREAPGRIHLPRQFLARVSGSEDLGVPELLTTRDLLILERLTATLPCSADPDGWHLRFGRELNASYDRESLVAATGKAGARPVLEGKQIDPFRVDTGRSRYQLRPAATGRVVSRARLAYRDVAGAGNRLTLIAAVIPARAVTTHTLFCLKTPLPLGAQHVLCALLNSFVANYLVRLRVSTHVTTTLMARLRLPLVTDGTADFRRLHGLSLTLSAGTVRAEEMGEYVELQALAARLYGLTRDDFAHILGTFPLIPIEVRDAALARFRGLL